MRVLGDNAAAAAYPKAQFDFLEAILVLPAGMDDGQQINIQCQVLEVGEIAAGDRARKSIRVTDEMGEETDSAGGGDFQSEFGFGGTGVCTNMAWWRVYSLGSVHFFEGMVQSSCIGGQRSSSEKLSLDTFGTLEQNWVVVFKDRCQIPRNIRGCSCLVYTMVQCGIAGDSLSWLSEGLIWGQELGF